MKKPLTKEQQNLVTENHNLIYEFAKRKHLAIDEYYGLLAIGMCQAAQIYNGESGKFSTVANKCMNNILVNHYEHLSSQRSIPEDMILSYDASNGGEDGDNNSCFLDSLADSRCTHDIVVSGIMSEILINLLSEREQMVVNLLVNGMTQDKIAERMGCKRQNIGYYIKQIRKKWIVYMDNN